MKKSNNTEGNLTGIVKELVKATEKENFAGAEIYKTEEGWAIHVSTEEPEEEQVDETDEKTGKKKSGFFGHR